MNKRYYVFCKLFLLYWKPVRLAKISTENGFPNKTTADPVLLYKLVMSSLKHCRVEFLAEGQMFRTVSFSHGVYIFTSNKNVQLVASGVLCHTVIIFVFGTWKRRREGVFPFINWEVKLSARMNRHPICLVLSTPCKLYWNKLHKTWDASGKPQREIELKMCRLSYSRLIAHSIRQDSYSTFKSSFLLHTNLLLYPLFNNTGLHTNKVADRDGDLNSNSRGLWICWSRISSPFFPSTRFPWYRQISTKSSRYFQFFFKFG